MSIFALASNWYLSYSTVPATSTTTSTVPVCDKINENVRLNFLTIFIFVKISHVRYRYNLLKKNSVYWCSYHMIIPGMVPDSVSTAFSNLSFLLFYVVSFVLCSFLCRMYAGIR
jgi:hypothetical protein